MTNLRVVGVPCEALGVPEVSTTGARNLPGVRDAAIDATRDVAVAFCGEAKDPTSRPRKVAVEAVT